MLKSVYFTVVKNYLTTKVRQGIYCKRYGGILPKLRLQYLKITERTSLTKYIIGSGFKRRFNEQRHKEVYF